MGRRSSSCTAARISITDTSYRKWIGWRAHCDETWTRDDFDLLPQLAQLRIPTLIISGDNDLIPVEVARCIAAAIPASRLVVIEDCGHFSYLEEPDRVHDLVTEFIRRPDRRSPVPYITRFRSR
jgi:pimeloyl-ACP methyl ester carboxylesterase